MNTRRNHMAKIRVNLSVDQKTKYRLEAFAEKHYTNVSQAVTDWIWGIKDKDLDEAVELKSHPHFVVEKDGNVKVKNPED